MSEFAGFVVVASFFWYAGYVTGRRRSRCAPGRISDLPPGIYQRISIPTSHNDEEGYLVKGENGVLYAIIVEEGLPQGWWQRAWSLSRGWYAKPVSVKEAA